MQSTPVFYTHVDHDFGRDDGNGTYLIEKRNGNVVFLYVDRDKEKVSCEWTGCADEYVKKGTWIPATIPGDTKNSYLQKFIKPVFYKNSCTGFFSNGKAYIVEKKGNKIRFPYLYEGGFAAQDREWNDLEEDLVEKGKWVEAEIPTDVNNPYLKEFLPKPTVSYIKNNPADFETLRAYYSHLGFDVSMMEYWKSGNGYFGEESGVVYFRNKMDSGNSYSSLKEFFNNNPEPKKTEIKISDEYTAVVGHGEVVVGCTTLDYAKVKEIYEATLTYK